MTSHHSPNLIDLDDDRPVGRQQPYSEKGTPDVTNDSDNIFAGSNGQLTLSLAPEGNGYAAAFAIGVQLG